MTGAGFQVPHFLFIDESHAEAFAGANRFNDAAQNLDTFASGLSARENDVHDIVFRDAGRFIVGIKF